MTARKGKAVAFRDVDPADYPFTIDFIKESDGEVIHSIEVPDAGYVQVPQIAKYLEEPVRVRVTYADGRTEWARVGEK